MSLNFGRPGLSVLPLGVGDAFSAIHHPTCMLVSQYQNPAWDNELILIDCPQSIRKMMREADDGRYHGLDLHRVNTLILTHLHADHAGGLETIAAFFKVVVGRKLRLIALPEVIQGIPRFLKCVRDLGNADDFFDIVPIDEGSPVTIDVGETKFYIEAMKTTHSVPTSALKIYRGSPPKPRHANLVNDDGTVTLMPPIYTPHFSYSCDTSIDHELWDWLWKERPTLVVHEVGHGPTGVHTTFDDLRRIIGRPFGPHVGAFAGGAVEEHLRVLRVAHYPDDMVPFLEATNFKLLRQGELEIVL